MMKKTAIAVWFYLLLTIVAEVEISYIHPYAQSLVIGLIVLSQLFAVALFYMHVKYESKFVKYIPFTALLLAVILAVAMVLTYAH